MSTAPQVTHSSPSAANDPAVAVPSEQFLRFAMMMVQSAADPEAVVKFIYASGYIDGATRMLRFR